jgi:hypothetical protein
MELLQVTSTLIEPELLTRVTERWRRQQQGSPEVAHAAVRELLEGGAVKLIQIGYRQTAEPPGVEVWVYRGDGNYGGPGADPLSAILAVGFAKWQGPHVVWHRWGDGTGRMEAGHRIAVCRRETVGDKWDLQRGLTVAFGRAIRQALDALAVQHAQGVRESRDEQILREMREGVMQPPARSYNPPAVPPSMVNWTPSERRVVAETEF